MNYNLENRVALVTGGSKGIGAAVVRQLASEGAKVYFCARASRQFSELEKELCEKKYNVTGIVADVRKSEDIAAVFSMISGENEQLDILVNNVGGAMRYGNFFELTESDWTDCFDFNVMTVVRFVRSAYPLLKKSQLKRIINVSSITGLQPGFYNPHYSITKSAVINLSKHLSKIFAKEQILVNTVCPGPVHSDAWENNVHNFKNIYNNSFQEAWDKLERDEIKKIPLGRVGEPEDISACITFLCSAGSNWITGSVFHINGGKLDVAL